MHESAIENKFCKYARKLGCIPYKFTSPNRRSVPDRMIVCPGGGVLFIEFKAPGKKPTDAQHREITRLLKLGHEVFVCDGIGQAEFHLDNLMLKYLEC